MKRIAGVTLGLLLGLFMAGGGVRAGGVDVGSLEVEQWIQGRGSLATSEVTLLVFWEAWCPHCRTAMPRVNEFYRDFAAAGLNVIGLTRATRGITEAQIRDYLRDKNIGFPIGKEKDGGMSAKLDIDGVPSAVAIRDNQIIWRGHPSRITEKTIRRWL